MGDGLEGSVFWGGERGCIRRRSRGPIIKKKKGRSQRTWTGGGLASLGKMRDEGALVQYIVLGDWEKKRE